MVTFSPWVKRAIFASKDEKPQKGIRWIINDREPVIRRVVWFFFTTFGIYYTWAVVYKNVNIYSKYTSSMVTVYRQGLGKPTLRRVVMLRRFLDGQSVEFPRVTTCLNSMHSRMVLNHIDEGSVLRRKYDFRIIIFTSLSQTKIL